MNTAEVIESDKLIAEFMEYETVLVPVSSYNGRGGVNISIVDGYHIPKHSWKNEVLSCKGTYDWSSSNLQFSFNWDWLMPVVERIESLKITLEVYKICKVRVAIVETKCNIDLVVLPAVESIAGLQTTPIIPMSFCSRNESKIKATYTAVIDFIKWYKKNAHSN